MVNRLLYFHISINITSSETQKNLILTINPYKDNEKKAKNEFKDNALQ